MFFFISGVWFPDKKKSVFLISETIEEIVNLLPTKKKSLLEKNHESSPLESKI